MIRRLVSGLYIWLPISLRVLRKVKTIVREEMNVVDVLEVLMPAVQPAELWQEPGHWEQYGPGLLRLKSRHEHELCVGPTHEEVITDLARNELSNYKRLPINFYQIQIKFRDEIRLCLGLMHGRGLIMKDVYPLHLSQHSLQQACDGICQAYNKIFSHLGLDSRPVQTDNGSIGGSDSHKFRVLANSGEGDIVFSNSSDYAASIEKVEAMLREGARGSVTEDMHLADTPNIKTIVVPVDGPQLPVKKTVKTLVVHGTEEGTLIALIVRGDHEFNEAKAANQLLVASPLIFASEAKIRAIIGTDPGSLGPVNLPIARIIDRSVALMSDFAAGANTEDRHYFDVNWERSLPLPEVVDLRNAVEGGPNPDDKGTPVTKCGIEVGHIFQFGTKYSEATKPNVLGEQGRPVNPIMGCYDIGVSRVIAVAIEQSHDERNILWPGTLAPFRIALVPLKYETENAKRATDKLYAELTAAGFKVLLDGRDKKTSPEAKFADMELIGVSHRIVINNRGLNEGVLEYGDRRDSESQNLPTGGLMSFITEKLGRRA